MRMFCFAILVVSSLSCLRVDASPFAFGGAVGVEFPFAHSARLDPGVAAEAFYRLDPYEIRFHYSEIEFDSYSVLVAIKYFFTQTEIRPYFEAALGPTIADFPARELAYGIRPEVTLGADLAINRNLSTGLAFRYFGSLVFGDTPSGKFEANHGLNLLANVIVWF